MINNSIIYNFFKDFTNQRKKTNRAVVLDVDLKKQGPQMWPSNNLENKTPSDIYWRIQLVCMKVQAQSSLEPPLEYNQDQVSEISLQKYYAISD